MEYDRPGIATIMHRTGVREGCSTGVEMGRCRYEIAECFKYVTSPFSSYYIIYIIILYKYYIQNIMIVV